ncbi:Ig-like domain-containing protein [Leptospira ilyithenensis]|uniref:SbsA Ig-like domain-containing protein n=1 Tax=Leptospira ilyithenensis TaxID=2484901 RepID=A0A4R9LTZ0_9LEPT|nr:Ig-like domain-containing protein [Leptospira ilyithenensis]TGN14253.1 hypothetical protein EHS11_01885 [Leptospira ilyithenensis]
MNTPIAKTFSAFRLLTYISWVLAIAFVSNCYLNPAIQSIINPLESKSSSAGVLALLGGGGSTSSDIATLQITGQLKTDGLNLVNGNLTVSYGSSAVRGVAVSTTTTTNSIGKFVLSLKPGTPKISVSDANGNDLGSFELNVPTEGDITEKSNSSSLVVSSLRRYTIDETPDITTDSDSSVTFLLTSSTPASGAQLDSSAAPNTNATLNFSLSVDSSTIDSSTIQVINDGDPGNPGTVTSLSTSGTVVTFQIGNLIASQTFTINLSSTIKSITGSSLPTTTIPFTVTSGGK